MFNLFGPNKNKKINNTENPSERAEEQLEYYKKDIEIMEDKFNKSLKEIASMGITELNNSSLPEIASETDVDPKIDQDLYKAIHKAFAPVNIANIYKKMMLDLKEGFHKYQQYLDQPENVKVLSNKESSSMINKYIDELKSTKKDFYLSNNESNYNSIYTKLLNTSIDFSTVNKDIHDLTIIGTTIKISESLVSQLGFIYVRSNHPDNDNNDFMLKVMINFTINDIFKNEYMKNISLLNIYSKLVKNIESMLPKYENDKKLYNELCEFLHCNKISLINATALHLICSKSQEILNKHGLDTILPNSVYTFFDKRPDNALIYLLTANEVCKDLDNFIKNKTKTKNKL